MSRSKKRKELIEDNFHRSQFGEGYSSMQNPRFTGLSGLSAYRKDAIVKLFNSEQRNGKPNVENKLFGGFKKNKFSGLTPDETDEDVSEIEFDEFDEEDLHEFNEKPAEEMPKKKQKEDEGRDLRENGNNLNDPAKADPNETPHTADPTENDPNTKTGL